MITNKAALGTWNDNFPNWAWPIRANPKLAPWLQDGPRDEDELAFAQVIDQAPKTELHVHVEASVAADFYAALNREHGLYSRDEEPTRRAPFDTFDDFLRAWIDNTKLLSRPEDYFNMGKSFVQERVHQNIIHTEAHTSVCDTSIMRKRHPSLGRVLPPSESLQALCEGVLSELTRHPGYSVGLIVDVLWFTTPSEKHELLDATEAILKRKHLCTPAGDPLIIGLGMGGAEKPEEAPSFEEVLERARSLGLLIDLHSGETASGTSARSAREHLKPDRVGHGISGAPDHFFEGHTATCPLSNVLTGVMSRPLSEHPIAAMREASTSLSVNSDDPLLFATTLTLEYVALRRAFGWDLEFFFETQRAADLARGQLLLKKRQLS